MSDMTSSAEELAGRLTPGMTKALERLAGAYVVSDGRSSKALVRRGLARPLGSFSDALLGNFTSYAITPLGKEVHRAQAAIAREKQG